MSPIGTHLGILAQLFEESPPLDDYGSAIVAYSLRNLITGAGNVIRVRRSSDNAESDFTASDVSDGTLEAWVGAGDGFVRTWYDQSGNNRHAEQSISGYQPKLVSSGSLITQNGNPCLELDGTNHFLRSTVVGSFSTPNSFAAVFSISDTDLNPIFDGSGTPSYNRQMFWIQNNTINMYAGGSVVSDSHTYTTNQQLGFGIFNGASSEAWINGVSKVAGNAGTNVFLPISIGTSFNSGWKMAGTMQELIVWNSDRVSDRSGIETNLNDYYSTYYSTKSVYFDGVNDSISIASPPAALQLDWFTNAYTISFWIKRNSGSGEIIANTPNSVTKGWGINFGTAGTRLVFWASAGGGNRMYHLSPNGVQAAMALPGWHHITFTTVAAGTVAGSFWTVDGTQYFFNDASGGGAIVDTLLASTATSNALTSGKLYSSATYLDAYLDELAILPALSLAQIQAIHSAGPRDLSSYSPISWWRFEDDFTDEQGVASWTNSGATFSTDHA